VESPEEQTVAQRVSPLESLMSAGDRRLPVWHLVKSAAREYDVSLSIPSTIRSVDECVGNTVALDPATCLSGPSASGRFVALRSARRTPFHDLLHRVAIP